MGVRRWARLFPEIRVRPGAAFAAEREPAPPSEPAPGGTRVKGVEEVVTGLTAGGGLRGSVPVPALRREG